MAMFFDRRAMNAILGRAQELRKADGRGSSTNPGVYLTRTMKAAPPPGHLKELHAVAIATFGGKVVRDLKDGLVASFDRPTDALRAALHAVHAIDLAGEMLFLPPCRIAISSGPLAEGRGKGFNRAAKILTRAREGEVVVDADLIKEPLAGYHDIVADAPRKGKLPGLGAITTVCVRPEGLKEEVDAELEDVELELRTNRRR